MDLCRDTDEYDATECDGESRKEKYSNSERMKRT